MTQCAPHLALEPPGEIATVQMLVFVAIQFQVPLLAVHLVLELRRINAGAPIPVVQQRYKACVSSAITGVQHSRGEVRIDAVIPEFLAESAKRLKQWSAQHAL